MEHARATPIKQPESDLPVDAALWDRICRELGLAPQQARIVAMILQGKRDKEIAAAMSISVPTVRTYLARVFERAKVEDRVALILLVFRMTVRQMAQHSR